MNFGIKMAARLLAGAFVAMLVVADADARVGGGFGSGSRGTRTFSAPPTTRTAPNAVQPMERSVTQPSAPAASRPLTGPGGFFNRPGGLFGGGLFGGLAAGFLGAGLFGLLFGHGFMGGLGGFASFFGLLLQVGLVAFLAMIAWRWFMRRNEPAMAGGPSVRNMNVSRSPLGGLGFGGLGGGATPAPTGPSDDIGIAPGDYDAFERLLVDIQTAYSNEDIAALRAPCDAGDGVVLLGRPVAQREPRRRQSRL